MRWRERCTGPGEAQQAVAQAQADLADAHDARAEMDEGVDAVDWPQPKRMWTRSYWP